MGPFGLGLLLGFVWLPCVGPTLGAAIALASQGQDLFKASIVMGSFGLGTAAALLLAASGLSAIFQKTSPAAFSSVLSNGKRVLGALFIGLGVLVVTGLDLKLEALVLPYLPEWSQF
jgi:cytochrome c biogenesis protein CcdA